MSATTQERFSIFTDPAAYADDAGWHQQAAQLRRETSLCG
jgi:hypothetical protein